MSYSFGMFFKHCRSEKEAYKTAIEVCKKATEGSNPIEILQSNVYYIPSYRVGLSLSDNIDNDMAREADREWLYSLFTFKFIYWKKHKILGMCGYSNSKEVDEMFDNHVSFQNSCDQNYDYSEWDNMGREIAKIVRKCKKISIKELLKSEKYSSYDEEDLCDIEYYRKSTVYEKVYEMLDLDNWLYGRDGSFIRFSICGIDSSEKHTTLSIIQRKIVRDLLAEEKREMTEWKEKLARKEEMNKLERETNETLDGEEE